LSDVAPTGCCWNGMKICGFAGSDGADDRMFATTPTIVMKPLPSYPDLIRWPSASSFANDWRASASLITATSGAVSVSASVKSRPFRIGTRRVAK